MAFLHEVDVTLHGTVTIAVNEEDTRVLMVDDKSRVRFDDFAESSLQGQVAVFGASV